MPQTLSHIDLSDHDAFVEGVPHEAFTRLRHEDPVHWNPEPDRPGFWAVTRYMDLPRHDQLRGLINRRFTPRTVGVWEDQVRKVTRELLARVDATIELTGPPERPRSNFVNGIELLPARVTA